MSKLRKKSKKKETSEIIKGAVVGGIVAGDAGAVVGATIAKNKIDNKKNNSSNTEWTPSIPYIPQTQSVSSVNQNNRTSGNTHASQTHSTSSAKSIERNSFSGSLDTSSALEFHHSDEWYGIKDQLVADSSATAKPAIGDDAPPVLKHYKSDKWNNILNDLRNNSSWKTGNISKDVEYCIANLEIVTLGELSILTKEPANKTRPCITPLMEANKVTRFEYDGRTYFAWEQGQHSTVNARKALSTAVALNYYNGVEWQNTKRTLMENGFTKTGRLEGDILYCLSLLKIAYLTDLSDILDEDITTIRPKLTSLMNAETVKRIEHNGRAIFVMADADYDAKPAVPTNNVNKFEEVKKFKELLDSGIISQEEFDAKKKQLLGL